jgi:hypothetical protein
MKPRGVWVIGKGQGKFSAQVVRKLGIPVVVVNHPASHRGKKDVLHEGLLASWQELRANAAKHRSEQ